MSILCEMRCVRCRGIFRSHALLFKWTAIFLFPVKFIKMFGPPDPDEMLSYELHTKFLHGIYFPCKVRVVSLTVCILHARETSPIPFEIFNQAICI